MPYYTIDQDGLLFEDLFIEWTVTGLDEPEATIATIKFPNANGESNLLESENKTIKAFAELLASIIQSDSAAVDEAITDAGFYWEEASDGNPLEGRWRPAR